MRWFLVSLVLVFLSGAAAADTLKMKGSKNINGDILEEYPAEYKVRTVEDEVLVIPKSMVDEVTKDVATVTLDDGRKLTGKLVQEDEEKVRLRMMLGSTTIPRDRIESIEHKTVTEKPKIWKPNPATPHSFSHRPKVVLDDLKFPKKTLDLSNEEILNLHREVHQCFAKKNYKKAAKLLEKIIKASPKDHTAWYNLACAYSLMKRKRDAVRALHLAVKAGFTDFNHIQNDPDLNNIRKEPAYKQLMEQAEKIMRTQADRTLEGLKKRFGEGYTYAIDEERHLIFATNQSMEVLEKMKQYLYKLADAEWRDFFEHRPIYYIAVVCPDRQAFRKIVPNPGIGGFYNPRDKILICGNIGYVLTHEFTHAMHFGDQHGRMQQHPIWIAEGYATLAEASTVAGGHLLPWRLNQRFRMIQMAVRSGRTIPLRQFFRYTHQMYMRQAGLCYAQGRYFMLYMWEKKLLRKWYDEYTRTFKQDPTGTKAVEKVFGKSVEQVEEDWKRWIGTITGQDKREHTPQGPNIGLTVAEIMTGVAVTKVAEGSAAKGKLKEGDMIKKVNGKAVKTLNELNAVLGSAKAGGAITFLVEREGKRGKTFKTTVRVVPR